MKLIPEISFKNGLLRQLINEDCDDVLSIYQSTHTHLNRKHIERMIDLSLPMAGQQRGIIWGIEHNNILVGVLSIYDWQPTHLKTLIKIDPILSFPVETYKHAVSACLTYMNQHFHIENFIFQWSTQISLELKNMMIDVGFNHNATLQDYIRISQHDYIDIEQYNLLQKRRS
jgi:hypothetical protein